jgi:hypothetical protein
MLLDLRRMGLIRREEWDANGRRSIVEVDGAHVHGAVRSTAGGELAPFDVTLPQESFSSLFLDAAMNAASLRQGLVLRVPAFDSNGRSSDVQWHHFSVAQRDTIRVGGKLTGAWLVEERAGGPFPPRRLWLTREPPYFPLDITWLPDGTTLRSEQRLVP